MFSLLLLGFILWANFSLGYEGCSVCQVFIMVVSPEIHTVGRAFFTVAGSNTLGQMFTVAVI